MQRNKRDNSPFSIFESMRDPNQKTGPALEAEQGIKGSSMISNVKGKT
jgi:hypothetical protein